MGNRQTRRPAKAANKIRGDELEELEEKLAEAQAAINPITSKLYQGAGGGDYASQDDDDQEVFRNHDEL